MEARAIARYVRVTPRKAGQVAKIVRGKTVAEALSLLQFTKKATAPLVEKAIRSAFANFKQKKVGAKAEEVRIGQLTVNHGAILKHALRYIPRAMGRSSEIKKRTCHIWVVVTDQPVKKGK